MQLTVRNNAVAAYFDERAVLRKRSRMTEPPHRKLAPTPVARHGEADA
jgi:hypothetical protein